MNNLSKTIETLTAEEIQGLIREVDPNENGFLNQRQLHYFASLVSAAVELKNEQLFRNAKALLEQLNSSGPQQDNPLCECHRCIDEKGLTAGNLFGVRMPLSSVKMILCPECRNKRCPKASDHRLECTQSNEPNQPGSVYNTEAPQLAIEDRMTNRKARHLIEQHDYQLTGCLLSDHKGVICSVNLGDVQWYGEDRPFAPPNPTENEN